MGNFAIATPELSDGAVTLTMGNELAAQPGTNLLKMQTSRRWQSSGLSSLSIVVQLLSTPTAGINTVALVGTNGTPPPTSQATWIIRGASTLAKLTNGTAEYNAAAAASNMFQSSDLANWTDRLALKWIPPSIVNALLWWRIDITDASNAAGYFRAHRLYIASAWQGTRNFAYGNAPGFVDRSPSQITEGGQRWIDERRRPRTWRGTIQIPTEDEAYNNAFDIMRRRGSSRDVLFIPNPDATTHLHRQAFYCTITDLNQIANVNHNWFTWDVGFEELI